MGLRDLLSSGGGRSGRLLPSDAPQTLEAFGRFEGPAPGGDMAGGIDLGQTIKKGLEADPDRALDEIVEACDSIGGWSYYGAWDILSIYAPQRQDDPRYTHIVDGLLDTLREEGYGPGDVPMGLATRAVERERSRRAASPEADGAPEPEPEIAPLADEEQRLLQIVDRPDGNQNRIYLVHRRSSDHEDHRFVAVIHHSEAADFNFATARAWHGGEDERAVYIRVAEAYANAQTASCGYWLEPSVQWYADRVR